MAWRAGTTAVDPSGWRASTTFFGFPVELIEYDLSLQDITFKRGRGISLDLVTYQLDTQGIDFTTDVIMFGWRSATSFGPSDGWRSGTTSFTSSTTAYNLIANSITYIAALQNVNLSSPRKVAAETTTFAESLQAVGLRKGYHLAADTIDYSLSLEEVNFVLDSYQVFSISNGDTLRSEEVGAVATGVGLENTDECQIYNLFFTATPFAPTSADSTTVTFTVPDLIASGIPFTTPIHNYGLVGFRDGVDEFYKNITLLPTEGNTVYIVTSTSANQTAGQSIFSGITIQPASQVVLPNTIDGFNATWEVDVNGHATGRLTLDGILVDPITVVIDFWDGNTNGWDTITVDILDVSDSGVAYDMDADQMSASLSVRPINLRVARHLDCVYIPFSAPVQNVALRHDKALSLSTIDYVATLRDVNLSNIREIDMEAESLTYTAPIQDISLKAARRMPTSVITYTSSLRDADLIADIRMDYVMQAETRLFRIEFIDTNIQYSGANTNPVLRQQQTPEFVDSGNIGLPGGPDE